MSSYANEDNGIIKACHSRYSAMWGKLSLVLTEVVTVHSKPGNRGNNNNNIYHSTPIREY